MFRHRSISGVLSLILVGGAVSACGGSDDGGDDAVGKTLTVVASSPPASLDPAKANVGSDNWFVNLAYDPPLRRGQDGKLVGDLATDWKYVGTDNKTFEYTLRSGLKFADGTPLDAAAAAASLNYSRKEGLNRSWTSAISEVKATGPLTVRITCSQPHPNLPGLLEQITMLGSVISPKGLADPKKLGTQSFGAGPYVLDTAQTASGDHYVYTPNPHYWDPSKIRWKKVTIKVISNPNSALQTVKTGQADQMLVLPNQAPSAKSSGLELVNTPIAFMGVNLADRDGALAKPLKDVRVRQALNYAVNRDAIAKAIFQEYGKPTAQISIPGLDGYVPELDTHYPYDPAKAKKLLADAGYQGGFTMKMETQGLGGIDTITQAVIQQWKEIGIKVELTTDTTIGQWLSNATSKKFSALGFGYGGVPTYLLSLDWMLSHPTAFNPFASQDPKLTALLDSASKAPIAEQPPIYQNVMRYVVDQAWFVSVVRVDAIYAFNAKKMSGLTVGPGYLPDLAWAVTPK